MAGDNETVAEIVSEMRGSTEQRYCSSKHCSVKVFNPILDFAGRIEAAHRREVEELRECLEQACGDKLGTYTMKGIEVQRWLRALGRSER